MTKPRQLPAWEVEPGQGARVTGLREHGGFRETWSDEWKMQVKYSIDKERRLILTTAEGRVVFDDIKGHQDRLLADPDFNSSFDQLINTIPAMEIDISEDEARILAERPIVSPQSRRAFVAVKPHIYGLGRMMAVYHVSLGLANAEVFHSTEEALKWLGREAE
jgi:hypothetical protein